MANATYVVIIEHGSQSWTIGPFHTRIKAESAMAAVPPQFGIQSWIEPVISPREYLRAIEQAFNDEAERDFEKRTNT